MNHFYLRRYLIKIIYFIKTNCYFACNDIYFWGLQFRPRWSERLVTTKYAEMEPEMEPDTEQKGAES